MHSSETSYSAVTIHWAGEAFFGHPSIAVRSSGYPRPMKNYCPISRWEILSLSTYPLFQCQELHTQYIVHTQNNLGIFITIIKYMSCILSYCIFSLLPVCKNDIQYISTLLLNFLLDSVYSKKKYLSTFQKDKLLTFTKHFVNILINSRKSFTII